jgi:hypothetical protein
MAEEERVGIESTLRIEKRGMQMDNRGLGRSHTPQSPPSGTALIRQVDPLCSNISAYERAFSKHLKRLVVIDKMSQR